MLPVQLALLKSITISALGLQLIRPILPAQPNSAADVALPNGLRAAANASHLSNSSSTMPRQWDGTIALSLHEFNTSLPSPSSNDPSQLWNDTYISTFNIAAAPRPAADLPPLPRGWRIVCSTGLGTGISPSSCLEAWTLLPITKRILSFGPRDAANTYDVGLPKRYLSSDGTCYIEPMQLRSDTIAYVKPAEAGIAAAYVIRQCVGGGPAQGGVTNNLRSGDDLAVRVAKFVPRVVCSALPYPREAMVLNACGAIVDRMEASKQERIFAQQDIHDPNLEISLPAYYTAPAEAPRCVLKVTGSLPRQFANWYNIWEAATAIIAMCIRVGKGGYWQGIGATESLAVRMGKYSG